MSDRPAAPPVGNPAGSSPAAKGSCIAFGCAAEVLAGRHWCGRHYAMIPAKLKARLWHATGPERERLLREARAAVETAEFGRRLL